MKRKRSDEIDAALRADPDYQDLCRSLDKQTQARKERLETYLANECEPSQDEEQTMDRKAEALKGSGIDQRIGELRDSERLPFPEIVARLTAEGITDRSGKPFKLQAVRKRYDRLKKKEASQQSQPCEAVETEQSICESCEHSHDTPTGTSAGRFDEACDTSQNNRAADTAVQSGEPCEQCESEQDPEPPSLPCEPCDPSQLTLSPDIIAALRTIAREEFQSMLANHTTPAQLEEDRPPVTPRIAGTRRYQGDRVNLPGLRIDKVLFERFENERRRLEVSASELMQRILWRAFGRPRLSFEEPEPPAEPEREREE